GWNEPSQLEPEKWSHLGANLHVNSGLEKSGDRWKEMTSISAPCPSQPEPGGFQRAGECSPAGLAFARYPCVGTVRYPGYRDPAVVPKQERVAYTHEWKQPKESHQIPNKLGAEIAPC